MEAVAQKHLTKGGEFLIRQADAQEIFIPEEFHEEQLAIAKMCSDFIDKEVMPHIDELDSMTNPHQMPQLMTKAGEQGLLGIAIPEEFGGFGQDVNTTMLTTEILGSANCFSVALLAHTGIGTLPILYYGNPEQKHKYLPKLASGEWKASYCLTEPGSGSDALGAKTKAILDADGKHYSITGQKMWITNGGFADLFIVFAKVDGEKFTSFIVERTTPGISMNEEEKKMGIKGSSTRQIFFNDVKVPVENVLGEVGKGHKVAFNILNIGRLKLAAATVGSSKKVIGLTVKYATERIQFGQPIAHFGAIQHKISEQAILTFANESATYRATNDVDMTERHARETGQTYETSLLNAAQEFASECSIMKVFGSEALNYVVDEGVQTYGGYGFSAEYPMDRAYRDSRINRIYEGTNEINRILSVSYLLGKALKGELNILQAAMAVQAELTSVPDTSSNGDAGFFAAEKKVIANLKKAILMVAGAAAQKYAQAISKEQEVLMSISDMLIQTYVAESTQLRVEKLVSIKGEAAVSGQIDIARTFLADAVDKVAFAGKNAIIAIAEGDMQRMMLMGLKRFTKAEPFNTIAARRRIAQQLIDAQAYCY